MSESVKALTEICDQAHKGGVPKTQLRDLVGKIKAMLGADYEKTKTGVGGPIYELVTSIKMLDKAYPLQDPTDVGDSYYKKNGQSRVRQLKWATGSSKGVLTSNLSSALSQLSGTVEGNAEFAPPNSMAIADVVLTHPPQSVMDTFGNEATMKKYLSDMVVSALDRDDSKLGKTQAVSVRVTMLTGGGQSTRYCVDFTSNSVTVRTPQTKSRDAIVLAEALIELFARDVQSLSRKTVATEVGALFNQLPSW